MPQFTFEGEGIQRPAFQALFSSSPTLIFFSGVDCSGRIALGDEGVLKDQVRELLSKGQKRRSCSNLGDVDYIDSSGIGERGATGPLPFTKAAGGISMLFGLKALRHSVRD